MRSIMPPIGRRTQEGKWTDRAGRLCPAAVGRCRRGTGSQAANLKSNANLIDNRERKLAGLTRNERKARSLDLETSVSHRAWDSPALFGKVGGSTTSTVSLWRARATGSPEDTWSRARGKAGSNPGLSLKEVRWESGCSQPEEAISMMELPKRHANSLEGQPARSGCSQSSLKEEEREQLSMGLSRARAPGIAHRPQRSPEAAVASHGVSGKWLRLSGFKFS